jgi:hypothetical protein
MNDPNVSHETIGAAYLKWAQMVAEASPLMPYPGDAFKAGASWQRSVSHETTPPVVNVSHETTEALALHDIMTAPLTLDARVTAYLTAIRGRDQLVKDLKAAGWTTVKIANTLGMGRSTVGRILGADWPYNHGKVQRTEVRRDGST